MALSLYRDGLGAGATGFDSCQEKDIFIYSTVHKTALGPTESIIQCVPRVQSLQVKHPPSAAKVKNDGAKPPFRISLHNVVLN
jgi:hypothetical protein